MHSEGQAGGKKGGPISHNAPLGQKYLVVVYREEGARKIIITAYFTSDFKRIKGDMIWKA
jgi:hypothetical protein